MLAYLRPLFLLLLLTTPLAAQFSVTPAFPSVTDPNGAPLPLAWTGGLNAPQPQAADLDGDGIQDLYLFDRAGDAQIALRGLAEGGYANAPELLAGFPTGLTDWNILRDFDGDGDADLFAHDDLDNGIRVYEARRAADGTLRFQRLTTSGGESVLRYTLPGNGGRLPIFVTGIDLPAIVDADFDGDLDVVTFNIGGGYLEWYRNRQVERGLPAREFDFVIEDQCWGGFFESGLTPALDLADEIGECFDPNEGGGENVGFRHAGSTVLLYDHTGNGLLDVLLGDISFRGLVLGYNEGTVDTAFIARQDETWPSRGVPVDIPFFPAAYHVDVDRDGDRDILAATSQTLNVVDLDALWWYENVGSDAAPDFQFRTKRYLVDRMLDFGSGGAPTVFDFDADGRPDIIAGHTSRYAGNDRPASLFLLRNVTPPGGELAFAVADTNLFNLSGLSNNYAPSFGDLDGDGDADALIGERGGEFIYIENTAGPGRPFTYEGFTFPWLELDANQQSKPVITDLDGDGLLDVVAGTLAGRISYFRNIGTATAPAFNPDLRAGDNIIQLGGINTNTVGSFSGGQATLDIVQNDDFTYFVTGNRDGKVTTYRFVTRDYQSTYEEVGNLNDLDFGGRTHPALGDFDGDGTYELVVGNERGGLQFFATDFPVGGTTSLRASRQAPTVDFRVFPNPASDVLYVELADLGARAQVEEVGVYAMDGQLVRQFRPGAGRLRVNVRGLAAGVYVVRVATADGVGWRRVVVE